MTLGELIAQNWYITGAVAAAFLLAVGFMVYSTVTRDSAAKTGVRPAGIVPSFLAPAVVHTSEELDDIRMRFAVELQKTFGKKIARFAISTSNTGRDKLQVRVRCNAYELKKETIGGKPFDDFKAQLPREFDGVPVEVTFGAA